MAQESAGPGAVIDACCLIDLLASGQAEAILQAAGFGWHLPAAVESEVHYLRQHDAEKPGEIVRVPASLSGLVAGGALTRCNADNEQERERFVHYAAHFRSDGEALCLALAQERGWTVATDDRKAIRVAGLAGLAVVSCRQLVKTWADAMKPAQATLKEVLLNIQVLAQFQGFVNPRWP